MAAVEDEIARFAQGRWGHFGDAEVERAYRGWHLQQSLPFTRAGMMLSIAAWVALAAVTPSAAVAHAGATLAAIAIAVVAVVFTLAISYRPTLLHWTFASTTAAGMLAGLVAVGAGHWTFQLPLGMTVAVAIIGFFGFTVFRMRPLLATCAVLPYAILHQILMLMEDVPSGTILIGELLVVIVMFSGAFASVVIDRVSRQAYRQERINEVQRLAIERERSRADVAERSRELWEALSNLAASGATGALAPGAIVAERYRVVRALGAGGMGEVYEVARVVDGRKFALKMLTRATDRAALMRFAREAEIAAKLDHPHVVGVFDVGVAPAGMFLVMELVAGAATLAQAPRADARALLAQVADALAAMHALGIVHRDLKPANILYANGRVKVADFGIACLRDDGGAGGTALALAATGAQGIDATRDSIGSLTRTGAILGTPLYMAPELVHGARDAEPRADLWSFGVIAFELLANRLPFAEPPFLARLAGRAPAAPESFAKAALAAPLAALLDRCLALEPGARPSAAEIRDALGGS